MTSPAFAGVQGGVADWLARRSPREQALLSGLAVLAVAVVFVTAIWTPLQAARASARADIHAYERIVARLRAAGPALAARPARRSGSPSMIVTETATEAGLTLQRLEPDGASTRVSLEDAPFDKIVRWLDRLETDSGLRVADMKLDRRPAPGTVNVQLTLAGR